MLTLFQAILEPVVSFVQGSLQFVRAYIIVNSAFKRMFSLRFLFRYLVHSAHRACAAQSLGKTLCAALRFMTPSGLLVKFGIQALCAVQSHIFHDASSVRETRPRKIY